MVVFGICHIFPVFELLLADGPLYSIAEKVAFSTSCLFWWLVFIQCIVDSVFYHSHVQLKYLEQQTKSYTIAKKRAREKGITADLNLIRFCDYSQTNK